MALDRLEAFEVVVAALREPGSVDWSRLDPTSCRVVAARAGREGVAALVARASRVAGTDLPQPFATALREAAIGPASDNLQRWHLLATVLDVLGEAGVPIIALKGVHLAEAFYRSLALRPMTDIDLLVDPADVDRAGQALAHAGLIADARNGQYRSRSHYHFEFRDVSGLRLELHWHLTLPGTTSSIDVDGVRARARPVVIAGRPSAGLADEDLLLHLAEHLCKHRFGLGLRGVCDLAEVITVAGTGIDWDVVWARASQWRIARALGLVLVVCQQLLRTPLPAAALPSGRGVTVPDAQVEAALGEIRAFAERPTRVSGQGATDLLGAPSLASVVAAALRAALPAPALLRDIYGLPEGRRWMLAAYCRRWRDLARHYGHHARLMASRRERDAARQRLRLSTWLNEGQPRC